MWTETGIKRRYITDDNEYKINFIPYDNNVEHHQLIIMKGELCHNFPIDDDYDDEIIIGEIRNKGTARLFNAKPNLDIIKDELTPKPQTTHKTLWCRGMPPVQVGMIGEFKGQKAIVTGKSFKITTKKKLIGIGDPENIMFEPKEVHMLGSYLEEVEKPTWTIQTKNGTHEIYNNSRWFKRKNCIIKDFNPKVHLKKYL